MRRLPVADGLYAAGLTTLPLVGVGLIHALTGIDVGAGLQPSYLLLALAWIVRLSGFAGRRGAGDRRRLWHDIAVRGWAIWGLAFAVVLVLSALGLVLAPARVLPHEAWPRLAKQLLQVGVMVAFLAYPAVWTRGPERWRRTVRLLAWATGLQLALAVVLGLHQLVPLPGGGILDALVRSNPAILSGSDWLYLQGFTDVPRLRGSMCEPLYLGSLLVGMLPLLATAGRRRLAVAGMVVLLLTWSRGAWLAAAVGLLVWWVLRRRAGLPGPSRRILITAVVGLLSVLVVVVALAGPDALAWPVRRLLQTFDRSDWSNLTRYYSLQAAWRAFLLSPLVGVGWGQYPYHFYAVVDLAGLESQFTWPVVNNVPMLVLCETGLAGMAVLAGAAAALWRSTWRILRCPDDPSRRARLAAVAAGSVGMGFQLLVFSQYNLPHLWVVPGLWLAALAESRRRCAGGTER